MKRRLALAAALLLSAAGCYHVHVVSPRYSDKGPTTTKRTVHALFWGLWQPTDLTLDCVSGAAADVAYGSNLGYSFLSVVTLGIWLPMDVQWTCATDPQTPQTFP